MVTWEQSQHQLVPVGAQVATGHISCAVCQDPVRDVLWICSGCYRAGHPTCLGGGVLMDYAFCADCYGWAQQQVSRMHTESSVHMWRGRLRSQLESWTAAAVFTTGTLGTIGVTIGGASMVLAQGTSALVRGAVSGVLAARQGAQEAEPAAEPDQSGRHALGWPIAEEGGGVSEEVVQGPLRPNTPTPASTPRSAGQKQVARLAGHCLACHTDNQAHVGHLY